MTYYFSKSTQLNFEESISVVNEKLSAEGFGILSEIDVKSKMKEKLDIDFRNYTILGACNPSYAYRALQAEPHIGTMLPCNVVVQEWEDGKVEVAAIDPVASMQAVGNRDLISTAEIIREKLQKVIAGL
ncbi:MAG: DUF302 domain-containing protein [Desulfuromonadales bacterium]|nr:DUF302 domain-containing protein [Desulfuromonadales bacterium]